LGRAATQDFDPEQYYTESYFSGQQGDGYADYRGAEPVLRREFAGSVQFIRRFVSQGRLLELGCAYGFFLKEAQGYFDVAGIELSQDAASFARGSGLNVLSGVADENNIRKIGPFDVIVLFDVIEHLPDPRTTLALCSRQLRPGGIMVITTGDFASFFATLMGSKWRLMTPPQHLWFFTKNSLCRLAKLTGLICEYADHPWKFIPLSLIIFQLRRMLGLPRRTTKAQMGIPLNLFDAMRVVLRKPTS